MSRLDDGKPLALNPLPPYEMRLLNAMAFFLGRNIESQAAAALAMYLRQAEGRIMAQVKWYAWKLDRDPYELMEMIYTDPAEAERLFQDLPKIHAGIPDVFGSDGVNPHESP
ncbi:MAG: hypothetical protein SFW36_06850 [Leptolyngbyaceae cyanobacterium bins.59]|nr:hypothetical protein [Leptolyngbyaceae cyanobacterium bins.59]